MPIVFKAMAPVPPGTGPSAPGQVTGLTATAQSSSTINLTWTATPGATLYKIFRNGSQISTDTASPFLDSGLQASTTYTYTMVANNAVGDGPPSAPASATTFSQGSAVKFNPGHYTESDTVVGQNGGLSVVQSEINRFLPFANIKGYLIIVSWGNIQQQLNVYDFTNLDTIVNYLKSNNKRFAIQVVTGQFTATNPGSTQGNLKTGIIPAYIQSNVALYGQAGFRVGGVTTTVSGVSGWWGGDGNGNTNGVALWRPNVNAEWLKLHQAIGNKYDSDPMFEGIEHIEDSFIVGTGANNGDPSYNDTNMKASAKAWLSQVPGFFPTSNTWYSETFIAQQAGSIEVTNWLTDNGKPFPNHPPGLAQTDALGAVQRSAIHTWGTQTYAGQLGTLGDRRSLGRFMSEIQGTDQGFFQNLGSPREDIKAGLDIMRATHAFWAIIPNTINPSGGSPYHYPVAFTAIPNTGTSGTLVNPWPLPSGQWSMVTNNGAIMTATKGSTAVTFNQNPGATGATVSILFPVTPFNWFNGGTTTPAQNGTAQTYTDAGLGTWINDPANALLNNSYPADYP